jgi:hypothetical protein
MWYKTGNDKDFKNIVIMRCKILSFGIGFESITVTLQLIIMSTIVVIICHF